MKIRNVLIIFIIFLFSMSVEVYAEEEITVIDLSKQSYIDQTMPGTYILTSSGETTNKSIGFTSNGDGDVFNIIIKDLSISTPMYSSALNFYNSYGDMTVNIIIDGDNSITSYGDNWSPITFLYTKYSDNITVNFGTLDNGGKLNLTATNGKINNKGAIGASEYDLDLDYPVIDSQTLNFGIVKYSKLNSINFSSFEMSSDITSLSTIGMQDSSLSINMELNYQINIADVLNGSIEYKVSNGVVTVLSNADKGYDLDNIYVNDSSNKNIELNNNQFVLSENEKYTIHATFKPIEYQFISGENAIYKDTDLVFTLDGEYDLVDEILVNGNKLDSNDYLIENGSTILTLKKDYLNTLEAGTYELTVSYKNGSSDTTTFVIEDASIIDNPETSDNVLVYFGACLISIIGLIGLGIYFKKNIKTR